MKSNIGQNIRVIRKALDLSVKKFAELTGVSKTTVVNVEQGHTGLKIETIEKLISFTDYNFEDLKDEKLNLPAQYRSVMFLKHKNDVEKREYFMIKPKILTAIDENLIDSTFFISFREMYEIVAHFEGQGLKLLGPSLQNELKTHPKVTFEKHPSKGNTFVYKRKVEHD